MSAAKSSAPRKNADSKQQQIEAMRLNNWADKLLGVPFRFGIAPSSEEIAQNYRRLSQGKPLDPPIISDAERLEIASYLRGLAQMPHAIEAILTRPKGRGKPPSYGVRARDWKVALDYALAYERLGKYEAAMSETRKAWKLGRTAVLDARKLSNLESWKAWAEYERKQFSVGHTDLDARALSHGLSEELRKSG